MENDKVVHSGLLLLPLTGKLLMKKSWQPRFCLLYKASKFGIERLEIYDNLDDAVSNNEANRIITLENCIKITKKSQTCFTIVTKQSTYEFNTAAEQQLNEWISAIQTVCFRDDISAVTSIVEDNELYSPSGEGVFNVKLHASEASNRCGLEPIYYTLVLTPTAIELRKISDNRILFTWPFCLIRRYGHKSGKFTFEAGRKCESGEGTFYLEHSNQHEIFRCVASKMKSMKKRLNESPPAILEVGDNQLHAALSMEARTRSPLPPSPTTSTTLHDIEIERFRSDSSATLSESSIKKLISSFEDNRKPQPPLKPPRKYIGDVSTADYETVCKYDEIEIRNNAWKTLGTDTVNHTENIQNVVEENEDEYISWGRNARRQPKVETKDTNNFPTSRKASKVITSPSTPIDNDSYDKLNFFGSSSKLNTSKSDYKQISAASMVMNQSVVPVSPPSFNPYDEVSTDLEGIRLADDSHLGYATVRKVKEPEHQYHNEDAYTIISKPKRV